MVLVSQGAAIGVGLPSAVRPDGWAKSAGSGNCRRWGLTLEVLEYG